MPSSAEPPPEPEPLSLWQTVKGDLQQSGGLKVVGLVLLLAWMAFQWGFGNDVLLPSIAASAFDNVDDGSSWGRGFASVGAAWAAGFLFWGLSQALDAIIVLCGFKLIPGVTARISRYLRAKGWVTPYAEMQWKTRWVIAYGAGVSLLALVDVFATGEPGITRRFKMIATSVLMSAGTVSLVVAAIVMAAMVGTRIPATEPATQVFIRFARNPLTWIALFVSLYAFEWLRGRMTTEATASDQVQAPTET